MKASGADGCRATEQGLVPYGHQGPPGWQLPKSYRLKERLWAAVMKAKALRMVRRGGCTLVLFARYFYNQMLIATK